MPSSLKILLIEDNEDDRYLTERALVKAGLRALFHVADGQSAVDYLQGHGKFGDRKTFPIPDVVLLDLKLPGLSGHQVLAWINTQPRLSACAVYILSSSGEARDRHQASGLRIAGYFVKPLMPENIAAILEDQGLRRRSGD